MHRITVKSGNNYQKVPRRDEFKTSRLVTLGALDAVDAITCIGNISIISVNMDFLSNELYRNLFLLSNYDEHKLTNKCLNFIKETFWKNEICILSTPIHLKNRHLFQSLLIAMLSHMKFVYNGKHDTFLVDLMPLMMRNIANDKLYSWYTLRLFEGLFKRMHRLSTMTTNEILAFTYRISLSPIPCFKLLAYNISGVLIEGLKPEFRKAFCNIQYIPFGGIDTADILNCLNADDVREQYAEFVKKTIKLFQINATSRDGGVFYETLVRFYEFSDWVSELWPLFLKELHVINKEGEFFSSLIKYWIPINVRYYKLDFYNYLRKWNIDIELKSYILLEIRRKGLYKSQFNVDIKQYMKHHQTAMNSVRIVTTYGKRTQKPTIFEMDMVMEHLRNYPECTLDDSIGALSSFFSQLFLTCHLNRAKCCKFFDRIYEYCIHKLNNETFEISVQIINLMWHIASGSSNCLLLRYKLDDEVKYDDGQNRYYQYLVNSDYWKEKFEDRRLVWKLFKIFFYPYRKNSACLTNLIINRYLDAMHPSEYIDLKIKFTNYVLGVKNTQNKEKIKECLRIEMAWDKLHGRPNEDIIHIINKYIECFNIFDITQLYNLLTLVQTLIVMIDFEYLEFHSTLLRVLQTLRIVFDTDNEAQLDNKYTKIVETLLNDIIECLDNYPDENWLKSEGISFLNELTNIVQKSNMKRPVTLASKAIKRYLINYASFSTKVQCLRDAFKMVFDETSTNRIRKNPEARLIIHSACLSDKMGRLFQITFEYLLRMLASDSFTNSTKASALNCLELLIADSSKHGLTIAYLTDVVQCTIQTFSNDDWVVRNAELQVLKVLIERVYGVPNDDNSRSHSISDLFYLLPRLRSYFTKILLGNPIHDKVLVVLLFFAESQYRPSIIPQIDVENDMGFFGKLLCDFVHKYSNMCDDLAVKSFASTNLISFASVIVNRTVNYLIEDYRNIPKNILKNQIRFIEEMRDRSFKHNNFIVRLPELLEVFKNDRSSYFDLNSVKLYNADELGLMMNAEFFDNLDYKKRIFLLNNISVFIKGIPMAELIDELSRILSYNLPEFVQCEILSSLIDRFEDIGNCSIIVKLIYILLLKIYNLNESSVFLIKSYLKVILYFDKMIEDLKIKNDLLKAVRSHYNTREPYMLLMNVYVISYVQIRNKVDYNFIKKTIVEYLKLIETDNEINDDLVLTLKHLYLSCLKEDKYMVMILIFFCLLKDSTCDEAGEFVADLTNTHYGNPLINLRNFLNYEHLHRCFNSYFLTLKFLGFVFQYMKRLSPMIESKTFYIIEGDLSVPKTSVLSLIIDNSQNLLKRQFNLCFNCMTKDKYDEFFKDL